MFPMDSSLSRVSTWWAGRATANQTDQWSLSKFLPSPRRGIVWLILFANLTGFGNTKKTYLIVLPERINWRGKSHRGLERHCGCGSQTKRKGGEEDVSWAPVLVSFCILDMDGIRPALSGSSLAPSFPCGLHPYKSQAKINLSSLRLLLTDILLQEGEK